MSSKGSIDSSPSQIRYIQGPDGSTIRRQGLLLSLQGFSEGTEVNEYDMYQAVASFLAYKHLEERSGVVLPQLPELLQDCDFSWTFESRNTRYSAMQAIRQFIEATTTPSTTPSTSTNGPHNDYWSTPDPELIENPYWSTLKPEPGTTNTNNSTDSNDYWSTFPPVVDPEDTATATATTNNPYWTTPNPDNPYWTTPNPELLPQTENDTTNNPYWIPTLDSTTPPTSSPISNPDTDADTTAASPTEPPRTVPPTSRPSTDPPRTVPPRPIRPQTNPPRTAVPLRTPRPIITTTRAPRRRDLQQSSNSNSYWATRKPQSNNNLGGNNGDSSNGQPGNPYWATPGQQAAAEEDPVPADEKTNSYWSTPAPQTDPEANSNEDVNTYWGGPAPHTDSEANTNEGVNTYWDAPGPQAGPEANTNEGVNTYWDAPGPQAGPEANTNEGVNTYWEAPGAQAGPEANTNEGVNTYWNTPGPQTDPEANTNEGVNTYWNTPGPQTDPEASSNPYWATPGPTTAPAPTSASAPASNPYWSTPGPQATTPTPVPPATTTSTPYWSTPEPQSNTTSTPYWSTPVPQSTNHDDNAVDGAPVTLHSPQEWQHPFAVVGATYSSVTIPLSILTGSYEIPLISGSATSAALDTAPLFARNIPTNAGDARAIMTYYKHLGISHVACLHGQDPWGVHYNSDLRREAQRLGISFMSIAYTEEDIAASMERLAQTGYKYIFAILFDWKPVLESAYDLGIIGNPEYNWIAAEMSQAWTGDNLQLTRDDPRDQKLAKALNGVGSLMLHVPDYQPFMAALQEFSMNEEWQQEFISVHPEVDLAKWLTFSAPSVNVYHYMVYDATIALGLAACQTPGLFTGAELHQTLVNLQFDGVTGDVAFIPKTGGRSIESVSYRIDNIFLSEERSDNEFIRFESNLAVMVRGEQVLHSHLFVYADNTTIPPPALPPLVHDYNLISDGVRGFGLLMASGVMFFSLSIVSWIVLNRKSFVVQVSQPIFLTKLCIGTIIMASAVIPLSYQGEEPTRSLDMACMATPWLLSLGFAIAFSALFSKTWRLNKLMNSGIGMRRIKVKANDVLGPFAVLITVSVALLLGWTVLSPLRYERILKKNYDNYGRDIESYGFCRNDNNNSLYFLVPLLLVNLIGVGIATYQSWIARNLPTELSESYYLAISMASLLESVALGGPIVYMTADNPTAFFLVLSALVCICCMTMLLPVFVPKYNRHKEGLLMHHHGSAISSVRRSLSVRNIEQLRSSHQENDKEGGNSSASSRGRMSITRSNSQRNSGYFSIGNSSDHSAEVKDLPRMSKFSGLGSVLEESLEDDEK